MRHPNIVEFIGAIEEPERLCIVTEFAEYGSLAHVLQKQKDLGDDFKVKAMFDCAKGMVYSFMPLPVNFIGFFASQLHHPS